MADFEERLKSLTGDVLAEIREEIPEEWQHGDLVQLEAHLTAVHDHAEEFIEQVRRRIA